MPFPQSQSAGSADQLSGPPPSPQGAGGGPTGGAPFSMAGLAPPPVPSTMMPPEVVTGILASAEKIGSLLDSYAQVAPDLAMKFAMIKDQLQAVLAELVKAGATPTSPTATGPGFPGGGMDRGVAGAGAV